ncbi:MAG: B12-binding domain-containing radical SAM protein [Acidobacteria bacterium]|nr:MAG: B12-binding domain-containing radical SAM protein [Acidobacteriota bacterium]
MKKIVLFLPPYSGPALGPPAGLLCLASPLRQSGYDVKIIDAAVVPDYVDAMEREIPDALCFGISLLTGPMIRGAIAAGRRVKERRPDLPVVLGGWHPSLLPEQTLQEPFVDVVVRYQGEITFLEVVRRLERGGSLDGVAGCSFKQDGQIRNNPDRPVARIGDLPPAAYDLADFDLYEKAGGERKLPYASSVGCPYACNYCTDTVFYNRRFNAYDAQRVVREVTELVARHRIEEVALLDSNFLVDTRRAVEIARGFLSPGARFRWTFQASTDLLCRMTDEEVRLLGRSGVRHIGFGTESASEEVLVRMNKRHQRVPDMYETARKCRQAGIRATFNLILGYPGETAQDRHETLRVMGDIARRFDNVTFSPNIFTAYPGIPIWPELRALGVQEPETMEGWTRIALGTNVLPWLRGEEYREVKRSMSFFMLNNEITKTMRRTSLPRLRRAVLRALQKPLHWRMKHQYFRLPFELWLLRARNRLVMRRSLLTGQSLGHSLAEIC